MKTTENNHNLRHRKRKEIWFRRLGLLTVILVLFFLSLLMWRIISTGYTAFFSTKILIEASFEKNLVEKNDFDTIAKNAIKAEFPELKERRDILALLQIISSDSPYELKNYIEDHPHDVEKKIQIWVDASSEIDLYMKGKISKDTPQSSRKLKDREIKWIDTLKSKEKIKTSFNTKFFTKSASRQPEQSGFFGAVVGSLMTLTICLTVCFPLGVFSAVYLEEFASKNKFTDLIEINLNNLAAIPSIIYGLLGLSVFLQILHIPRSSPLVGGLTLALMVLPVIVITTRNALKAVPPSIRQGALALGASPVETLWHHTLPLALPGIMTGTILAISRALGETAPLIMIGMVAFVADVPKGFLDAATVMPVQIYLWASSPEMAFAEKTSAGIIVLLLFLISFNIIAVWVRKKSERKW